MSSVGVTPMKNHMSDSFSAYLMPKRTRSLRSPSARVPGLSGAGRAGLVAVETLRRVELVIGGHLLLVTVAAATEREPEVLGGAFDLVHGVDAMALVIVVGRREGGIGLAQEAGRG